MIYGPQETGALFVSANFRDKIITKFLSSFGLRLVHIKKFNPTLRKIGRDWPITAHTMIGLKRLDNIQFCIEEILKNNIKGDLIEAGIWRGGATIFMRAVLKAYNEKNRTVYVADSFKGLPKPNFKKFPEDPNSNLHKLDYMSFPLTKVKTNFKSYNLLDGQVRFLEGWFKDTLPKAKIKKLSLIRADADYYESTMDILTNLYPKLSRGGYVIVDDFRILPACHQAVLDFRKANKIRDKIITIDWSAVYWKKN